MAVTAEAKPAILTSRPRDGFQWIVGMVASAVPALLLLIVLTLLLQAMPAILHFGWRFLVSTDWNPASDSGPFGALPAIFGTVFSAFLALALALPVGVAGGGGLLGAAPNPPPWVPGAGVRGLAPLPHVASWGWC